MHGLTHWRQRNARALTGPFSPALSMTAGGPPLWRPPAGHLSGVKTWMAAPHELRYSWLPPYLLARALQFAYTHPLASPDDMLPVVHRQGRKGCGREGGQGSEEEHMGQDSQAALLGGIPPPQDA
jgi:hypothetical protein